MKASIRKWCLGSVLGFGVGSSGWACAFHGYTPNPTLVDLLLLTEQVVVAQLDPNAPNRYVAVDALLGPDALNIPIDVHPDTRSRLSNDPSATLLLARDGAYGSWMELAILDDQYRDVIETVVAHQSDWFYGNDADRVALFVDRVNDPNPELRQLALQELDRVPYATLKSLNLPKIANLKQDLEQVDYDVRPIQVLLAGLSQDSSFSPVVAAGLARAVEWDVPYLGAYVTALIELDGQAAVQDILNLYLKSDALSLDTREKILAGFALQHRTAEAPVRREIARALALALRASPDLQPAASRQFGLRSHWSLSPTEGRTASGADR